MIVINRMFNGGYLEKNLGHEIINLFRSDNGECYLYLNHNGRFNTKHSGKIKKMLLVRWIAGQNMIEVVGKAEDLEDVYPGRDTRKKQHKYIVKNDITYGGAKLYKIFQHNNSQQDIFITFHAKKVHLAKRKIYITTQTDDIKQGNKDENSPFIILIKRNLAKTSLKQYIPEDDEDYQTIDDLFSNNDLWQEKEVEKVNLEDLQNETIRRGETMFDVCGITDNELAWSNALAYFMQKYPSLVTEFAKEVLKVASPISIPFSVVRESEDNIDIYIEDKKSIIIIENKIMSSVNGINSMTIGESQLSKYYAHAKDEAREEKTVRCYLLTPDYNNKIDLTKYKSGIKYKEIHYSDIYKFLCEKIIPMNDVHLNDFAAAMYAHTTPLKEDLLEEMKRRFAEAIGRLPSRRRRWRKLEKMKRRFAEAIARLTK